MDNSREVNTSSLLATSANGTEELSSLAPSAHIAKKTFASKNLNATIPKALATNWRSGVESNRYNSGRLVVLGKGKQGSSVGSAIPVPINTFSLRQENNGQNINVPLVPTGGCGWGSSKEGHSDQIEENVIIASKPDPWSSQKLPQVCDSQQALWPNKNIQDNGKSHENNFQDHVSEPLVESEVNGNFDDTEKHRSNPHRSLRYGNEEGYKDSYTHQVFQGDRTHSGYQMHNHDHSFQHGENTANNRYSNYRPNHNGRGFNHGTDHYRNADARLQHRGHNHDHDPQIRGPVPRSDGVNWRQSARVDHSIEQPQLANPSYKRDEKGTAVQYYSPATATERFVQESIRKTEPNYRPVLPVEIRSHGVYEPRIEGQVKSQNQSSQSIVTSTIQVAADPYSLVASEFQINDIVKPYDANVIEGQSNNIRPQRLLQRDLQLDVNADNNKIALGNDAIKLDTEYNDVKSVETQVVLHKLTERYSKAPDSETDNSNKAFVKSGDVEQDKYAKKDSPAWAKPNLAVSKVEQKDAVEEDDAYVSQPRGAGQIYDHKTGKLTAITSAPHRNPSPEEDIKILKETSPEKSKSDSSTKSSTEIEKKTKREYGRNTRTDHAHCDKADYSNSYYERRKLRDEAKRNRGPRTSGAQYRYNSENQLICIDSISADITDDPFMDAWKEIFSPEVTWQRQSAEKQIPKLLKDGEEENTHNEEEISAVPKGSDELPDQNHKNIKKFACDSAEDFANGVEIEDEKIKYIELNENESEFHVVKNKRTKVKNKSKDIAATKDSELKLTQNQETQKPSANRPENTKVRHENKHSKQKNDDAAKIAVPSESPYLRWNSLNSKNSSQLDIDLSIKFGTIDLGPLSIDDAALENSGKCETSKIELKENGNTLETVIDGLSAENSGAEESQKGEQGRIKGSTRRPKPMNSEHNRMSGAQGQSQFREQDRRRGGPYRSTQGGRGNNISDSRYANRPRTQQKDDLRTASNSSELADSNHTSSKIFHDSRNELTNNKTEGSQLAESIREQYQPEPVVGPQGPKRYTGRGNKSHRRNMEKSTQKTVDPIKPSN